VAAALLVAGCANYAAGTQQQASGGGGPAKNAPKFRDLTFGQAPTADMIGAGQDSGLPCFARPSDDLSVGYGKLSSLRYCFYNNKLIAVLAETKGLLNSKALLETLIQKYGSADQPNEFMPRFTWGIGLWQAPLTITYDRNQITDDATVVYESTAVQSEMQAAQTKATSKAASQF